MANEQNLTPWPKGVSGNPSGTKPGTKHLSTWVQEMLNDENFELFLEDRREGFKRYEGAPVKAIVTTAIRRAAGGDKRWADWLRESGYGTKIDHTTNGKDLPAPILGGTTVKQDEDT